jgi:hypothetical protein
MFTSKKLKMANFVDSSQRKVAMPSLARPAWNVIRKDVHGLEHHLSQKTLECLERLVKGDGLGTDG